MRYHRVRACVIAMAACFATTGCEGDPSETDFRAFSAEAAARRDTTFLECRLRHHDPNSAANSRAGIVRCMERQGYSYQPR